MKLNYLFNLFLLSVFCISCSDDIEFVEQKNAPVILSEKIPVYRTEENAIIEVESFIKGNENFSRSELPHYSIGSEIYFCRDTVTNQEYPSFYIANADGENGYAIISANPYTTPIIAYSESGNLSLNDTLQYKELSFFFNMIDNYISNTFKYKVDIEEDGDDLLDVLQTRGRRLPLYDAKPGEWQETARVPPLISVKWGQKNPYNNAAPYIKDGQRALTGCVATAVAQIMAYHERPSEYDGVFYDWTDMKKNPSMPEVAHLFRSIGDLVKMQWGLDASGAYMKDIPQCFEKMGYKKITNPQIYSQWDVITSIKAKCPVIISGNSVRKNILGIKFYRNGHAWVADGYFHRERKVDMYRKGKDKIHHSYVEKEDYLHLNWGWNGISNGYYLAGVFNGGDGPAFPSSRAAGKGNYPYNIEIIPYINLIK